MNYQNSITGLLFLRQFKLRLMYLQQNIRSMILSNVLLQIVLSKCINFVKIEFHYTLGKCSCYIFCKYHNYNKRIHRFS